MNRTFEVYQGVHLERALTMMKCSPWTKFKAQFNRAAVKSIDHFIKIKPKFLSLIQFLRLMYQGLRKVLIDTPILLLISFRQSGLRYSLQSRSVQIASAEVKSSLNISQTGSICDLSKAHHHELVTAIELYSVPVALIPVKALLKLIFINERHNLCKYCFSFVHSLVERLKRPNYKTTSSNRKILSAL